MRLWLNYLRNPCRRVKIGISLGEIRLNRCTAKGLRMYKERTAVGDGCNVEIAR
jgi:hypothetical protein